MASATAPLARAFRPHAGVPVPNPLAFFVLLAAATFANAQQRLDLAGTWRLRLDRDDVGLEQRWFAASLPERIALPGDLAERGFGDLVNRATAWTGSIADPHWLADPTWAPWVERDGRFRFPFWLQPERTYAGAAWFQRDLEIPSAWQGQRVVLFLERPHWETRVWVDGRLIGTHHALATPHEYDSGKLAPGQTHAHDPRGQSHGSRHRRKLAQRQRSHAGQLERDRRRIEPARHAAGLD